MWHHIYLTPEEGMKVKFNVTQREYLSEVERLTQGIDEGRIEYQTRFRTEDPVAKKIKYDYVKLVLLSSGETEAAFCAADISYLSIKQGTAMKMGRTYKVSPKD
jgi:hypothetical protein